MYIKLLQEHLDMIASKLRSKGIYFPLTFIIFANNDNLFLSWVIGDGKSQLPFLFVEH